MNLEIKVLGTEQVAKRLLGATDIFRRILLQGMQRAMFAVQAHVVNNKLAGQVLKRRTGNLASSINSSASADATEIKGVVGTPVFYGRIHELGGQFNIPAHQRTVTKVFGRPVAPTVQNVRAHIARFPARSFLRTGLRDMEPQVRFMLMMASRQAAEQVK